MSINLDEFERECDEWVNSVDGKTYFEKLVIKRDIAEKRYKRFEEWLEHNDFDKLMYRLILEHGEEWREKCWSKGYEVHPNNKLQLVIDYVFDNLASIEVPQLDNDFPNQVWFFKGYYFQLTHGQGSVVDIYNVDDFKHLLSA
jgi:hypothetical protein